MTNNKNQANNKKFDLEERTAKFGENILRFVRKIQKNEIDLILAKQLIRAATSVGANYCEADDAESKKDFIHKIGLCKKESRETKHWLRMLATSAPDLKEEIKGLWREAQELNLIFAAIRRNKKN